MIITVKKEISSFLKKGINISVKIEITANANNIKVNGFIKPSAILFKIVFLFLWGILFNPYSFNLLSASFSDMPSNDELNTSSTLSVLFVAEKIMMN